MAEFNINKVLAVRNAITAGVYRTPDKIEAAAERLLDDLCLTCGAPCERGDDICEPCVDSYGPVVPVGFVDQDWDGLS